MPSVVVRACLTLTLCATAVVAVAAPASAAYDPSNAAQKAQYERTLAIADQAYQYGVPLLDMDRAYRTSTSVNVANGRGGGPVNRFSDFAKLADAKDRAVVAPNNDTLYSNVWLDLRKQPQVIHVPKGITRFHVIPMLSPYEENFANIGSPIGAHPDGDYVVTGPGWKGKTPKGATRIRSPYDRVWIVGRTEIVGASDLKATRKIMRSYSITPLNRWNRRKPYAYTQPKPRHRDTTVDEAHIPGTAKGEDPATFFDALGDQLRRFPPPTADAAILAQLRTIGIGPGRHPTTAGLSDAQLQALRDAVSTGRDKVRSALVKTYLGGFDAHNGWLVTSLGHYGTDYATRAVVDQIGLGAPTPNVAVYPFTQLDRDKGALTGKKRYVVHFPKASFPVPVKFFWSLTLYDGGNYLVDNPLDRYLVNDRSKLTFNTDGSLDVYVQPDAPASAAQRRNWLPSPTSAALPIPGVADPQSFHLNIRLYGMKAKDVRAIVKGNGGWPLPTVLPCLPDGKTRLGVACAG
jgi:hypothetical protein